MEAMQELTSLFEPLYPISFGLTEKVHKGYQRLVTKTKSLIERVQIDELRQNYKEILYDGLSVGMITSGGISLAYGLRMNVVDPVIVDSVIMSKPESAIPVAGGTALLLAGIYMALLIKPFIKKYLERSK